MALRHSDYLTLAAIAAFAWIAALGWYSRNLRAKAKGEYRTGGLAAFAAAAMAAATSFGYALLLRAGGVQDLTIAAGLLVVSALALELAIWWQMRVHHTEDLESLSIDMVASGKSATAMTAAGTAFAPFGLITTPHMSASDVRFWVPMALFLAGVLVYSLIARSGGRRFSEALDRKYPHFRDR